MLLCSNLKRVGLRGVNILVNYDLMSKECCDREGKERIVGNMF